MWCGVIEVHAYYHDAATRPGQLGAPGQRAGTAGRVDDHVVPAVRHPGAQLLGGARLMLVPRLDVDPEAAAQPLRLRHSAKLSHVVAVNAAARSRFGR